MGANHARVVAASDRTHLAVVVDVDVERARAIAEPLGAAWSDDIDAATSCAGAIVAAPTEMHVEIGLRLIKAGLPLLVEKPLAPDLAGTQLLLERSAASNLPLMCGFVERFNPAVATAREMLDHPPLHVVAIRHSPANDRIVTDVVYDLLIHDLDLAILLCQGTPDVLASGWSPASGRANEIVDAVLTFPSGAVATCSSDRWTQRKVRTLQISTASLLVEVDLLRQDITIYRHVHHEMGPTGAYRADTVVDIPFVRHSGEPLALQLQRFDELILGTVDPDEERGSLLAPHVAASMVIDAVNR